MKAIKAIKIKHKRIYKARKALDKLENNTLAMVVNDMLIKGVSVSPRTLHHNDFMDIVKHNNTNPEWYKKVNKILVKYKLRAK